MLKYGEGVTYYISLLIWFLQLIMSVHPGQKENLHNFCLFNFVIISSSILNQEHHAVIYHAHLL